MRYICLALILSVLVSSVASAADEPIKVVVWDEQQPAQKKAYPNFLGNYIADYLKRQPGLQVHSVSIDHPQKGLSDEVLDNCDVLVWWGHVRNRDISEADARPVVERLKQGKLSLLALHSAHWATPFVMAMQERAASDALAKLPVPERKSAKVEFLGEIVRRPPRRDAQLTPSATFEKQKDGTTLIKITRPNCCFPAYKNHGQPSEMRTLLPDHPIAKGIPKTFTLPHTEMYDEPFHVPAPDAVVFEEHWKEGQHFRSGMVWQIGKGRVCYFRPGHETHAVFTEELPMNIVENAVRFLGSDNRTSPNFKIGEPVALFDGTTLDCWTTQDGKPVTRGWKVDDGTIYRESRGGNIFYEHEVGDFELKFQWKIVKGGNNGLKYRVRKYGGSTLGCEYQLLGETGRSLSKGSCGSLYALYEPNENKKLNPIGEWNSAKIIVHGPKIEHWMNGAKIVEADLASEEWRKRLSQSKFSKHKDFARNSVGRIMLTDHGSEVWYRDLILTPLATKEIPPLVTEPSSRDVAIFEDAEPQMVLKKGAGEGPAWDPKLGLLFSGGGNIMRLPHGGAVEIYRKDAGTNGLLFDHKGNLLACEPKYRQVTRTDSHGKRIVLADRYDEKRFNQPNDITVDSKGRIYFSDPCYGDRSHMEMTDEQGKKVEGVYRIDPDGKVTRIITHEVDRPNGLVVTPDDRYLYVADNNNNNVGGARKLWRFQLKGDGSVDLSSQKLIHDWKASRGPDGMVLDQEGRLYVAGGLNKKNPPNETNENKGGVYVFSPAGKLLKFVHVPRDEVTNCTFGGEDLKTLYITAGGTLWSIRTTTPGRMPWPARK